MKFKFIEKIKLWFLLRKYGMKRLDAESPFLTLNSLRKLVRSKLSWRQRKFIMFVIEKDFCQSDIFVITKKPLSEDLEEKIINSIYQKKSVGFLFKITFAQDGSCLQPEDQKIVRDISDRSVGYV